MPTYSYRGFNAQGQKVGGSLQCATRARVEELVSQKGITHFDIYESKTHYNAKPYALVSPTELAFFCRELSVMLSSDMSQSEGLMILSRSIPNQQLKITLIEAAVRMENGLSLSGSLSMYNHIFGTFLLYMIAAGEASGSLTRVLPQMADYFDREARLRARLRTGLYYPLVRLVLMWGVVFVLLSRCIPVFEQVFHTIGATPHGLMGLVFMISGFFSAYWPIMVSVILVPILVVWAVYRVPSGRIHVERLWITLSGTHGLTTSIITARFTRGLALMLQYNASPLNSDACLQTLVNNHCLEEKILTVFNKMRSGQDLLTAIDAVKHFPPHFPEVFEQMLLIGYNTNKLRETLDNAAEWLTEDLYQRINRTTAILEPLLMMVCALAVGLPLLSVLLPLLDVMKMLGS